MATKQTSFQTPSRRVRYLGAAHSGTQHAWGMRVSSAALTLLTIAGVWLALALVGKSYAEVREIFGHRVMPGTIVILFVATTLYHMKLGMQTIVEDYVHDEAAKTWALMANSFFCALLGVATAVAVLKLCVGA